MHVHCGLPGYFYAFVVIPAQAGIQEARPEGEGMAGFYRMAHWIVVPVIVIPAVREWII